MSKKGTKRTGKRVGDKLSQKNLWNRNHEKNSLRKILPCDVKDIRRLVTPATKQSHAYGDYASHAYEDYAKNTTSSKKKWSHHQDPVSDEDVMSFEQA